jgi:hypothetical protein
MDDELVQAGWEQDQRSFAGGTVSSKSEEAWYQVAPQTNQISLNALTASHGDVVWSRVDYDPSDKKASFYICNESQDGTQADTCIAAAQQVDGDVGDQAEWIVERTTLCDGLSCSYPSLPNIDSAGIFYPEAFVPTPGGSEGFDAATFNPHAVDMRDCSDTLLAHTVDLQDEYFYVDWDALGESDPVDCGSQTPRR